MVKQETQKRIIKEITEGVRSLSPFTKSQLERILGYIPKEPNGRNLDYTYWTFLTDAVAGMSIMLYPEHIDVLVVAQEVPDYIREMEKYLNRGKYKRLNLWVRSAEDIENDVGEGGMRFSKVGIYGT